MRLSYKKPESNQLEAMLPHIDLLADSVPVNALGKAPGCRDVVVTRPTPEYLFLHEAEIIGYHGILFASWYNCHAGELKGYTSIPVEIPFWFLKNLIPMLFCGRVCLCNF